jgi:hypothetical protein
MKEGRPAEATARPNKEIEQTVGFAACGGSLFDC